MAAPLQPFGVVRCRTMDTPRPTGAAHGRPLARHPPRRAKAPALSRFHPHRGTDARSRHRGEFGNLQRSEHRAACPASVSRSGPAGDHLSPLPVDEDGSPSVGAGIQGLPRPHSFLQRRGGRDWLERQPHRARRPGAACRYARQWTILRHAGCRTGHWTSTDHRRRPGGPRPCGRAQRWAMEAAVRRKG